MDRIMYTDYTGKNAGKIWSIAATLIVMLLILCFESKPARASEAVISVKEVNYLDSTITLQVNNADTEVYFSDLKKKIWETVPGSISSFNTITMDISWIPVTKNYVLTFKANKSTGILSVTIPKQATNFKASFNKVKNTMLFNNAGRRRIEWRKKGSYTWNIVNQSTINKELSYLYDNGAVIYFRLEPINGTGSSNMGYRPSKEVSVSIPKKADAPSVTVDGSKFRIAVKKGMAYRAVDKNGTAGEWINIGTTSDLLLKNIAPSTLYTGVSGAQSEITLQFRTNVTSSSMVSKISSVTIPIQEGPPNSSTNGISLNYTSSSSLSLQVKAASAIVPYEYTIVKKDQELDYQTADWTIINSSTVVALDKKTAPEGCRIYVRKKSIPKSDTTDFALASKELDITGTAGISYPASPTATTLTTLITTSGVCKTDDSTRYLNFTMLSATSTTVSSIKFKDSYGITKGSVTCSSTVAKNADSIGANDKYIITTKITSTEEIDTITEEKLYAEITLANTDVITSTDTAGVILYLYPKTTVKNPSALDDPNKEYTDHFKRIYMSNDTDDDNYFKFKLDLGTKNKPDGSNIGSFTSEPVTIDTIKFDGYTLINGTDYKVEHGNRVENNKTIETATVTVYVSRFEQSTLIDNMDMEEALRITLNNGEKLNEHIYMKLIRTATIDNVPIAWTITEKSLEPKRQKIVTNPDKSTETVTEEIITYTINLTLFDKAYGVGISDVTWGGVSILGSTNITNGKAVINLSNAKINTLTTDSTDTKNIVITLSNGYVIKSGCKLTILNAL